MSSSSAVVTETVLIHLKENVDFRAIHTGQDTVTGAQLAKLAKTVASREGFIRQYWGQQVEKPDIFVWSIDWQSFEHHKAFINHEDYKVFLADVAQVFDLEVAAPLMMHTTFTSDANAARDAPCTETAFFMLANDADDNAKSKLEDSLMPLLKATSTTGNSLAFAVGWVFEEQPHAQSSTGQATALQALVGWNSIEDHQAFRKTSQFAETIQPVMAQILPFVQDARGMFHVEFSRVR